MAPNHGYDPRDPRNDPRDLPNRQGNRDDSRDPRGGYNDHRGDPRGGTPQRSQQRDDRAPAQDEVDMSGTWPCRPVKHRFGEAGTKAIQIGVRVRFTGGKFQGRMCNWYATFSDNAEDITLRGMDALGFRGGEDIMDCRGFYDAKVQAEIPDAEAVVEYERNPQTGRMVNKVKFINGGEIRMAKDLSPADEQRFRQRMRGSLARRGGSRGGGVAPQQPSNQQQGYAPPPQNQGYAPPQNQQGYAPPQNGRGQTSDPWDDPNYRSGPGQRNAGPGGQGNDDIPF